MGYYSETFSPARIDGALRGDISFAFDFTIGIRTELFQVQPYVALYSATAEIAPLEISMIGQ